MAPNIWIMTFSPKADPSSLRYFKGIKKKEDKPIISYIPANLARCRVANLVFCGISGITGTGTCTGTGISGRVFCGISSMHEAI